jgi:hypothetical protein
MSGGFVSTRLEAARRTAKAEVDVLAAGSTREELRGFCCKLVDWVFDGGTRPGKTATTFVRETVVAAVNAGLEFGYGERHRGEINPDILTRRDAV